MLFFMVYLDICGQPGTRGFDHDDVSVCPCYPSYDTIVVGWAVT